MSFTRWLQNLQSALAGSRERKHRQRRSLRAATHRPQLEALEDRCLLSFNPAVNYGIAPYPLDMVAGDFNGDAKADLVMISDTQVSVLPCNGGGTFGTAQTTSVGSGLRSVAAGDFNGDDRLDLAITSSVTTWNGTTYVTSGSLLLLLNNTAALGGPVTFQAARTFNTGTNLTPGALAVGDLNGDAKLDVAVAQAGGSNVSVLQGDGAGNLGTAGQVAVGPNPVSVAVGDLDGDGRLDLVTANQGSSGLSVLRNGGNDGAGNVTFQPATSAGVYGSPTSVAVGDFNNDGRMDLTATSSVVTTWGWWGYYSYYSYSQTDGYENVLLGHGDGTFDAAQSTWVDSGDLADLTTGDFNGDGKLDAAMLDGATAGLTVLPGKGDGTFKAAYSFTRGGSLWDAVATADFNGDAFPDVAVANYYSADVSVLLNDTDWRTVVVSGLPAATTAGESQTFTVTVLDNAGNVQAGYGGTMHFTSGDPQADLPTDYQFTAADAGVHAFTVAFKTAGSQWVTATDTAKPNLVASQGISVTAAAASTLQIGGFPSSIPTGNYGYFSVSALDAYGNAATGYTGTVHFTSSDGAAVLPANYTFSQSDYGTGYFSAALETVGTQSMRVTDLANPSLAATQSGIRVNPLATITGPNAGLRNQTLMFTLGAASGLPASTVFTDAIDWNYDGIVDQTVSGPSGTTVTHSYANTGWYYVGVTATVHVGGEDYTSNTAYQSVSIFAVTVTAQADPGDGSKSALVVQGTADGDYLTLSAGAGNAINLYISGYAIGSFSAPGGAAFAHLLVYGNGGDDSIYLTGGVAVPALVFGGDGNDSVDASGSIANNVLVGGAGNDWMYGGNGRDLLIGGTGADTLLAGSGGAILIGSYTDYDANLTALLAMMKEWSRTDVDYITRVKHLNGTLSGGLNGSYRLTKTTVHDDTMRDNLYGGAGPDWFILAGNGKKKDTVYNRTSGEVTSTL